MVNASQIRGGISELAAESALMSNGWEVSKPSIPLKYDLVGKDPVNGQFAAIQVKSLRRRPDRNNALVVYTSDGNGNAYDPSDCPLIVAVDNERHAVYMFENTGQREYWATEISASERWVKLTDDKTYVKETV